MSPPHEDSYPDFSFFSLLLPAADGVPVQKDGEQVSLTQITRFPLNQPNLSTAMSHRTKPCSVQHRGSSSRPIGFLLQEETSSVEEICHLSSVAVSKKDNIKYLS